MGVLTRIFELRQHPSSHDGWTKLFGGGPVSHTGVHVDEDSAMTLSVYFACVRVIAESVASLPLITYRRQDDGGKERAVDHPLYHLLHDTPNPEQTSFEFRETLLAHVASWGNGYVEIEWNNAGQPIALWPLNPARMQVKRRGGLLRYDYRTPDGEVITLQDYQVHHLRGMSGNGITGYSIARMAMQSIGLGLATEEFGSRFFGDGARPGVVLKHPGELTDEAFERLKESWNSERGLKNAHRVKILEEGLDLDTIGVPPEEAQFLETRKFQVSEIARWFRMQPHMIGDLERATFSNIEHQSLDFVIHTLRPWLVRSEQALARDLLLESERQDVFVEYLVDGLLRGDISSRYEAYSIGIQNSFLSPNDVRRMENMNPREGGDDYLVPLNMLPSGQAPTAGEDGNRTQLGHEHRCDCDACRNRADDQLREHRTDDEETELLRESREKLMRSYVRLYEDVARRVVRREMNDLRRAVNKHLRKRSLDSFRDWLDEFYEEFRGVLAEQFLSLMLAFAEQMSTAVADELDEDDNGVTDEVEEFIEGYLENFAIAHTASSRNQIDALIDEALLEGEEPADYIEERLDGWEETRGAGIALQEAFNAGNALSVALYVAASVTVLRWLARGDSCEFCQSLNGKTVDITGHFVESGTTIDGGAAGSMLVRRNKRHGPLHKGCDCIVVAG